ncbi:nucleotide pyrophosphohydrolase [Desulfovibrio aminophilus]|nr:nucleotide pyrophosphohydrolase [Desulfovibrio aminophilus]MCM0756386.1 nucleotide pyrophosphohydrolase [Desulfovibrio aminophilus]
MHEVESATIEMIRDRLRAFVSERGWQRFQTPKNLVMALSVECGELVEQFQWLDQEESRSLAGEKRAAVEAEMADVFIYLLRLADELDVDLTRAAWAKMARNEAKYAKESCGGKAPKA